MRVEPTALVGMKYTERDLGLHDGIANVKAEGRGERGQEVVRGKAQRQLRTACQAGAQHCAGQHYWGELIGVNG